jgi:hypothetical protein
MPTGYTCIIEDREDVTFAEYVWRCARAFGALIEMRDAAIDAAIPAEFVPSTYHVERLAEARARLRDLGSVTVTAAKEKARAEHREALAAWKVREAKRTATLARYDAIRAQAARWEPPTADHAGLRDFMLQQIDVSTEFMRTPRSRPKALTGQAWLDAQIASAKWDVDYHEKQLAEERSRVASRNTWVAALRQSVPPAEEPKT